MTKVLRTATRLLLHLTHFVTMFNDVFLVEMNCLKSLFLDIYLQIRFSRMNYSYNNILLWLCPLPISFFFVLGHVNIFFKYFLTANMKYMKYMSVGTTTLISYNIHPITTLWNLYCAQDRFTISLSLFVQSSWLHANQVNKTVEVGLRIFLVHVSNPAWYPTVT